MWHSGAIMLIEIWERLRGYDKWIQSEATIQLSELKDLGFGSFRKDSACRLGLYDQWQSKSDFCWIDKSGISHTGSFTVSERSPLFQVFEGQSIPIRFDPANPDKYYIRELFWHKSTFLIAAVAAFLFNSAIFLAFLTDIFIKIWRHHH
jgi:hypothetical protein